jgi:hypothetical protein
VLTWVLDAAPGLPGGRELLATIEARHPEWEPTDHPDLRNVVYTGWRQPNPPMTVDKLHRLIGDDPHAALSELQRYEHAPWSLSNPTWEDTLELVCDAVGTHPTDGIRILDAASNAADSVAPAIVRGWSQARLAEDTAELVPQRLLTLDLISVAADIADLLADGGRRDGSPTEWFRLPLARDLATRVWDTLDQSEPETSTDDWLGRAINHPAGKLAQFWLHAVASDWRTGGDSWKGLPPDLASSLECILAGQGVSTALAEPVIASQLRLLHGADPGWALRHVLPLLDWEVRDRAVRAWHGFLFWGRPTRPLLHAGLLDHYLQTVRNADQLSDELRRQLARHLAGIATSPDPPPDSWVDRFTVAAAEEIRIEWLVAITWMLRDLPDDEVAAQWSGWLRPYCERRLRSVPLPLTQGEASAMAGWAPHLGSAISECAALVVRVPASLDEDRLLVRDLANADEALASEGAPIAELLAHLLGHTTEPLWDCGTLREIVARLRTGASSSALQTIREQALRLGCRDAADW